MIYCINCYCTFTSGKFYQTIVCHQCFKPIVGVIYSTSYDSFYYLYKHCVLEISVEHFDYPFMCCHIAHFLQ